MDYYQWYCAGIDLRNFRTAYCDIVWNNRYGLWGITAYMRVIAIGIPFQLICPAFTAMIRADGSPQYTMKCMMAGAVVNIILDPVFIFGLKNGLLVQVLLR